MPLQGQMDEDVQKALKQILMMCKMPGQAKDACWDPPRGPVSWKQAVNGRRQPPRRPNSHVARDDLQARTQHTHTHTVPLDKTSRVCWGRISLKCYVLCLESSKKGLQCYNGRWRQVGVQIISVFFLCISTLPSVVWPYKMMLRLKLQLALPWKVSILWYNSVCTLQSKLLFTPSNDANSSPKILLFCCTSMKKMHDTVFVLLFSY